jgi:WD40 repeat protein
MHVYCTYIDACLWSCSLDTNIRVWDLNSGKCVATIGLATEANAHKSPVAALEVVTCADGEYVASGSADGELKLWRNNGEFAWSGFHSGIINCLRAFKDELGGGLVVAHYILALKP